jgi:hypothetical protein
MKTAPARHTRKQALRSSTSMNRLRVIGMSNVAALRPDVSILALVLGVLLLSVGLLLGSTPAAG